MDDLARRAGESLRDLQLRIRENLHKVAERSKELDELLFVAAERQRGRKAEDEKRLSDELLAVAENEQRGRPGRKKREPRIVWRKPVWAFGEMIGILWKTGKLRGYRSKDAALRRLCPRYEQPDGKPLSPGSARTGFARHKRTRSYKATHPD